MSVIIAMLEDWLEHYTYAYCIINVVRSTNKYVVTYLETSPDGNPENADTNAICLDENFSKSLIERACSACDNDENELAWIDSFVKKWNINPEMSKE